MQIAGWTVFHHEVAPSVLKDRLLESYDVRVPHLGQKLGLTSCQYVQCPSLVQCNALDRHHLFLRRLSAERLCQ